MGPSKIFVKVAHETIRVSRRRTRSSSPSHHGRRELDSVMRTSWTYRVNWFDSMIVVKNTDFGTKFRQYHMIMVLRNSVQFPSHVTPYGWTSVASVST